MAAKKYLLLQQGWIKRNRVVLSKYYKLQKLTNFLLILILLLDCEKQELLPIVDQIQSLGQISDSCNNKSLYD